MIKFFIRIDIHCIFAHMKRNSGLYTYMNKIFFFIASLLILASCSTGYRIEGSSSLLRLDGKMLFVKVPQGNQMIKIDSAEVIHGLFSMEGAIDSVMIASLYMDDESIMPFVIEDGQIQIKIDNAYISVSGTPLNDRLYTFVKDKGVLEDRAYELELNKQREQLSDELDELAKKFIQSNYDNVLGPGVFIMLCNAFPYPVLTPVIEEIVNGAPDTFKNNRMVKGYMEAARENMEKLQTSM